MGEQVVYVDIILLGNFVVDYVLLWVAGVFARVPRKNWRLLSGALFGAVYALLVCLPGFSFLGLLSIKLLVSLGMVSLAYAPKPWKVWGACLGFFYLASFALGGSMVGFSYLLYKGDLWSASSNIGKILQQYFWPGFLLAFGFLMLLTWLGPHYQRQRCRKEAQGLLVTICLWEAKAQVQGLVDTGNSLKEPVSQAPVVIVEYGAIQNILPPEVQTILEHNPDSTAALAALANTPWYERMRLIPFQSLGQQQGLLLGLKPDYLEIPGSQGTCKVENLIIGLSQQILDPDQQYRALLHPDLLGKQAA